MRRLLASPSALLSSTPSALVSRVSCGRALLSHKSNIPSHEHALQLQQQQQQQQQQRTYGTKKPLFLRGKRNFKHYEKLKRLKEMSDMARVAYQRQKERTKTIQWKPETEVEKHYVKMMMDLQKTRRNISERALLKMLDVTQDKGDLQFVLRLYRLLRIRHSRFSTDLTSKLVEVLERLNDVDSIHWILKHPIELDLPPTRAIVHKYMSQLAEKEQYEDILDLFKNISTGKYMLKLTDNDMTLMTSIFTKTEQYDKILEAYNTKVKRKYREYQGEMSQNYRHLLKACETMQDLETAAKIRTEITNNAMESEETKQSIVTEFSEFLAKIDKQETATEAEEKEE